MAAEVASYGPAARLDRLTVDDFDTASVHSVAPSYISEAPSYHSTMPAAEQQSVPAYTPRSPTATAPVSTLLNGATGPAGVGLPRIPSPPRRASNAPQLKEFRIPTWSTVSSNPTARQYHNVAHRRVSAASSTSLTQTEGALRTVLTKLTEEQEASRLRPLEDPYLVGEEAAAEARRERLARENGIEILIREDQRWDWFLAQMQDWDERDRSWAKFRKDVETGQNRKLARRIGRW